MASLRIESIESHRFYNVILPRHSNQSMYFKKCEELGPGRTICDFRIYPDEAPIVFIPAMLKAGVEAKRIMAVTAAELFGYEPGDREAIEFLEAITRR